MQAAPVRITAEEMLSDNWYLLKKYSFDLQRRDGSWQAQTREVYDRGNGATILLYNRERRTVLLIRQFRMPTYVNDHSGYLIETAAGLLDNASPEERIRLEAEEETGYRVGAVEKVYEAFMSPGSVTERIHFFIGEYSPDDRIGDGGGLEEEGEDIEVLELGYQQALDMVRSGEIVDGKTIMLLQYLELRLMPPRRLTILVAVPRYSATDDATALAQQVASLDDWAAQLFEAGHSPVFGQWLGLAADASSAADEFQARARQQLQRCDALLRIGGACARADALVAMGEQLGLPVYRSLQDIPRCTSAS
ncbi:GDP-mannose pyrophosphatase NudK [Pseudomonas chlororaphis]|uniref:GDP-mannose pyrophosphatase NudK n=1 Tax=Pseudomonas chlororaphis TaxID=587753 RepID=UPI0006A57E6C|nr:GDP-mannose pyrophosphatase NudK [Pseudomonas chlororaphis]AZD02009.1 GDP-mannose pyrophosphatase NudK [Pseudomonas chlororaphis subsp. chlororaphis]MBM0283190.1 GDP-mannose pyrophosphatase NudK [Pseudomonas chlororaphis]MDO1507081.1 GDP-mannose pyrophosphatase NudK [Pseudomonas chlororaphis]ORM45150.1 GDP-mannose pyrophosphatase NudK [Pseudomonas chlororaphis subsp. chlororaphis]TWR98496.1 GDP-mannose pyrophosphatase NudK [Pseudomonas chlororaphis subsp. chlororaphis]